jgi:DNA-binding GntR family transcriptional regulator
MLINGQAKLLRTMRGDLVSIIQEEILGKKFKPGERMLEEVICAELGISRTPVREALVVLEQRGLVVQKPHRGSFVATFSPNEIADLLRLEAAVEGLAASLAAQNRTEEQLQEMEALTGSISSALTEHFDTESFYNYDRNFHYKMVECSGSPIIVRVVEVQLAQIYLCRYYTITAPNRFIHSVREHQEIIECLKRSDPAGAERAARNHLESVIRDYQAAARSE